MSDTTIAKGPLWLAREAEGLSREQVARLLDPPPSAKTIERWEKGISPLPKYRANELALIYRVQAANLRA